ncbi:MAG: hypothetical protein G3M70_06310 [Candidatus Nitronauta litoralis]|uniref:Uncharacterized protein n=1 Tax=Candidatus Nitronauta litoralis TaxID=2705533 RepID=A0A7T0BW30_9BACT|nr:MAG: hypothetical protein G3M70_06310 [Candidatus Nitronauta litoralis]
MNQPMFSIPRISESFIEGIAISLGWKRYLDIKEQIEGRANADFIAEGSIIELKILEEEGLEKAYRQDNLASLFCHLSKNATEVNIDFDSIPEEISHEAEKLIAKPIQKAVKKASKQIRCTREDMNLTQSKGILLIINNGYKYLTSDNFEYLVKKCALKDSSQIDFVYCVTVEYHQGEFDSFIFCITRCHFIGETKTWKYSDLIEKAIQSKFSESMSQMMKDQMNPEFWRSNLEPVSDIVFEREGVRYIRRAPHVPDSRS